MKKKVYGRVVKSDEDGNISSEKYVSQFEMPRAKDAEEFAMMLSDFLAINGAEFALQVEDLGIVTDGSFAPFAMFSASEDNKTDHDRANEQFARIACMFRSVCETNHLNMREELIRFSRVLAQASVKMGDDSFLKGKDGSKTRKH